jgi:hypothetical protein
VLKVLVQQSHSAVFCCCCCLHHHVHAVPGASSSISHSKHTSSDARAQQEAYAAHQGQLHLMQCATVRLVHTRYSHNILPPVKT